MIRECEHCGSDFDDGFPSFCPDSPSRRCVAVTQWYGYKFYNHPHHPNEDLEPYKKRLCAAFKDAHFPAYVIGQYVLANTRDIVGLDAVRKRVLDHSRIYVRALAASRTDSELQALEDAERSKGSIK